MRKKFALLTLILLLGTLVYPQEVIRLYEGKAPGSEGWNWQEKSNALGVYNVVDPTLTVFKADSSIATGTAVIVCPGGGFHFLSISHEGYDVAKWLNAKGITAFVLKYRLIQILTDNPFQEFVQKQPNTPKFNKDIEPIVAMAIADGKAAVIYVKNHAQKFGVDAKRIGIMGFSAGGTVTTGVAFTYDALSRPAFVAPIYPYVGSYGDPAIPADAPPMFIVAATDDVFGFHKHCTALYNKWVDAGMTAELHIYARGNHGFGMNKQNLPTDTWIERMHEWMKISGF